MGFQNALSKVHDNDIKSRRGRWKHGVVKALNVCEVVSPGGAGRSDV